MAGTQVAPGETRKLRLKVSERYTGSPVTIPLRVRCATQPGPVVFVTAAVHGDELNGIGVVRDLLIHGLPLTHGAIILAPMINVFGVEQRTRYLPDRRDLNRSFPGSANGSLASRIAHSVHSEIIRKADFGIDLHTAAVGRTNYPHIRADLTVRGMPALARAFGCEIIVDQKGDGRTLRSSSCKAAVPTILLEAGEALKIEPSAVAIGVRGVLNVLRHLGMMEGDLEEPAYQTTAKRSVWVRSPGGGLLRFHVSPGEVIDAGQHLATIDNFFAEDSEAVVAPCDGVVIGMPTMPAVKPGDPVCNIAQPETSVEEIRAQIAANPGTLHRKFQEQGVGTVAHWTGC